MLDSDFIASVLISKNLQEVYENKIDSKFLKQPYSDIFKSIQDYFKKYGEVPPESHIYAEYKQKHPEIEFSKEVAAVGYYCDELKNREKFNSAQLLAKQIFDVFSNADTPQKKREAVAAAESAVAKLHNKFVLDLSAVNTVDITQNAIQRFDELQHRAQNIGKLGVPIPWEPLQDELLGWQPGDFVTFLGKSGLGKTFGLMHCATYAHSHGAKTLVFSHEMTIKQLSSRFDALMAKIDPKALKKATLTSEEEYRYKVFLEALQEGRESGRIAPFIVNQGAPSDGGDSINAIIKSIKPDIVIVDGAYLFSESYSWDKVSELTKMLKISAMLNNVPILCSNQYATNKMSQTKSAFSSSFINDSSVVIEMFQEEERKSLPFMTFRVMKGRDLSQKDMAWVSNWDFEEMDFSYCPGVLPSEIVFKNQTE